MPALCEYWRNRSNSRMTIQFDPKYLSLVTFMKEAWENVLEPGTPLELNWHHYVIANTLQAETLRITQGKDSWGDIIINIPFRSSKSRLVTVCYPVWSWIVNPQMGFLTLSYSQTLSTKHARESRDIILSQWFQERFGHIFQLAGDQNMKTHYSNDKKGERLAGTVASPPTGSGGDVIIIDDPHNTTKAESQVQRESAVNNYRQGIYNRTKNPKTAVRIIIMQRLHEEDLSGFLLNRDKEEKPVKPHRHICIPGEASKEIKPKQLHNYYTNGLFDPKRFSRETLDEYKTALGSYGYAGQIMQVPAPDEGGILKKDWFEIVAEETLPQSLVWNFLLDPAYTEKATNDPSAIMTYAFDGKNWYIRNVKSVRFELPQLLPFIKEYVAMHGYTNQSLLKVEPKASGLSIIQTLRQETNLNVLQTAPPKDSKLTRVQAITPRIEAGRVKLVKGNWNESFLEQCGQFPNGKHDDEVDCLCMALDHQQMVTIV